MIQSNQQLLQIKKEFFLDNNNNPLEFYDIAIGGIAIGVPGLVSMLDMAHKDYGLLEWESLFQPAIKIAKNGFKISPRLYNAINKDKYLINSDCIASFNSI